MTGQGRPHRRDPTLRSERCVSSDGREEPKIPDAAQSMNVLFCNFRYYPMHNN